MLIRGSRIVLTGASSGIGAALAPLLAAQGAKLLLVSRRTETIAVPGAQWCAADLADPASRPLVMDAATQLLGGVDILINNAGVGAYVPTHRIDRETWRRMREVNLDAPVELTRLCLPGMRERRSGQIVNIASIAGLVPLPWFTLYSATKAALVSFTHALRMELDGTGISTVAVCPGYVQTPFQANVIAGQPPEILRTTRRFAISPQVCAEAIVAGILGNKRTVTTPLSGKFLEWAYAIAPSLVDRQFARYNRNLEDVSS